MSKKIWMDEEYLKKECLYRLGIPDERMISKRYLKLLMDIFKIVIQLSFYHFAYPHNKARELMESFISELRKEDKTIRIVGLPNEKEMGG